MSPFPGTRLTVLALPECFHGTELRAGKKDRIKSGYHISIRLLICWAALITIAFVFFHGRFLCSFSTREVIRFPLITCGSSDFPKFFSSVEMMTVGALSGLGRTRLLRSDQRWPDCYTNSSCTSPVKHCTGTEWNLVSTDTFHRFKGIIFVLCFSIFANIVC